MGPCDDRGGVPWYSLASSGCVLAIEFLPSEWTAWFAQAGQPLPATRLFPVADHWCSQAEHLHGRLLVVPAMTVVASPWYSLASSGCVLAIEFLPSECTTRFAHAGQPLPATRSFPVADHWCSQAEHLQSNFLLVPTARSVALTGLPLNVKFLFFDVSRSSRRLG